MTALDLEELRSDPTITPEMIDFVLACEQAEVDLRNGAFKPVPPTFTSVEDFHDWDKLEPEASTSI